MEVEALGEGKRIDLAGLRSDIILRTQEDGRNGGGSHLESDARKDAPLCFTAWA